MLRSLASSFVYKSSIQLSIFTRMLIPATLLLYISIGYSLKLKPLSSVYYIAPVIAILSAALYINGSFKRVLAGLQFVVFFIAVGLTINLFAKFFNFWNVEPIDVLIASLKGALMFMTIALIFQWIRVGELQWLLEKISLSELGASIAIALSQLPSIMIICSEALATVRMKYSSSRFLYRAVMPMILYTVNHAKELAEAIYIYGIPDYTLVDLSVEVKDVIVIMLSLALLLFGLLVSIKVGALL